MIEQTKEMTSETMDHMLEGVSGYEPHENLRTKKITQLSERLVGLIAYSLEHPVAADDGVTKQDRDALHNDLARHLVGEIAMKLTCANFDDKHKLMVKHMEALFSLFTWLNEGIFEIDNQNYQDARDSLDLGRHRLLDIIDELRATENFVFNQDPMMTIAEHQQMIAEAEELHNDRPEH